MQRLWQQRQQRDYDKKEASLSQQKKWLFDQAREYHARSCHVYDEDEVMTGEYTWKHALSGWC